MAKRNDWMDQFGCCKVCHGEIPTGHADDCDYWLMEQRARRAEAAMLSPLDAQNAALRARVAELEAAVTRYRQYEYVEAQHDETGRSWFGARYNIPTRFHEVSNESGEPGPTARAAVNKDSQRKEEPT
jgi:hypothetical protein